MARTVHGVGAGASVEVDVVRVGADGAGVTAQGLRVPGVLTGERALVRVDHVGVHAHHGALRSLRRASPQRAAPRCPQWLICGGCQLLHASPAHQRELKRAWVRAALEAHGVTVDVEAVAASPADDGYRAVAKFVVGPGGTLGSYAPRSHDVVSMRGCRIHHPTVEAVAEGLRAALAEAPEGGRPGGGGTVERPRGTVERPLGLRYVVVRVARASGTAVVTLVAADRATPGVEAALDALVGRPEVMRCELHRRDASDDVILSDAPTEVLFDRGPVIERLGPVTVDLVGGAFNQVNPAMAERLYRAVLDASSVATAEVADLYAGSGVLAAWMRAEGASRVVAVEAGRRSVEALRGLAARDPGIEVVPSRVEEVRERWEGQPVVVANPPRKGLSPAVIEGLVQGRAERLTYVSCSPDTLGRDAARLVQGGFRWVRLQPFDLFPHTRHVECVASFERERD
jgi:23S rRNA (uracil1939-C5)-methyltransferase